MPPTQRFLAVTLLLAALLSARSASPAATGDWPQFRGPAASGVGDGLHPPTTWDVPGSRNVRWKTPIPGLGHSSPIVWGDRVFVTTAVSGLK